MTDARSGDLVAGGGGRERGHTPGPWQAVGRLSLGAFQIQTNEGVIICERSDWHARATESEANGHLIAASPDLLAALNDAAFVIEAMGVQMRSWEVDPVVNDRAILTRVRSAIAKALDQPAPPPPHNPKARQR